MPDQIRNERVKLRATWLNNTAVAVTSLGVLTPTFLAIFRTNDALMQDGTATREGLLIALGFAIPAYARLVAFARYRQFAMRTRP